MSSAMMAPVAWVTHVLWITAAMLSGKGWQRAAARRARRLAFGDRRPQPGVGWC